MKTKDEYDVSSLGSMAFGQGLAIPLVQLVRAYGAVANGGVPITPHFLVTKGEEEVDLAGRRPRGLCRGRCPGGGDAAARGHRGHGKERRRGRLRRGGQDRTGEVAAEDGSGYVAGKFVASLAGFANADDPRGLCVRGLNGVPYLAAESAASVFHDVMTQTVNIMGVSPVS